MQYLDTTSVFRGLAFVLVAVLAAPGATAEPQSRPELTDVGH